MSGAALLLALALLVASAPSGNRIDKHRHVAWLPPRHTPVPSLQVLSCIAALAVVLAIVGAVGAVAAVAIVGATVGVRRRRGRRQRRRTAEAASLQGALDVLVSELRIGAHPVAALSVAAEEVDGVVAASLRTVAARARMGADVPAGMRSVAKESALPAYWERLAVCWHLAQTHGLAIATLMQAGQRDIVERERFSARVNAEMAGARTTAAVLAGLPILGIGLGQLIGANPVSFLLSRGVGEWLLVTGVVLACTGLMWSDRITSQVLR